MPLSLSSRHQGPWLPGTYAGYALARWGAASWSSLCPFPAARASPQRVVLTQMAGWTLKSLPNTCRSGNSACCSFSTVWIGIRMVRPRDGAVGAGEMPMGIELVMPGGGVRPASP